MTNYCIFFKQLVYSLFLLTVSGLLKDNISAQVTNSFSKMNFELMRRTLSSSNQQALTDLFIQGDIEKIKSRIQDLGGHLKYSCGDIAVITVPLKFIRLLSDETFVKRIESRTPRIQLMSDSMRIKTRVDQVQAGQFPLTQGYDGTGVVMGIIDSGIDLTNPDFKDSLTGRTRVKYIWDQNKPNSIYTPSTYGYGQEWNYAQIDAGLCTSADTLIYGHGTASSGISAGNGNGSPRHKYRGVAPGAEYVIVALNFASASPTTITDAVNYIFSKAALLGEPCVINLSLGNYYGSHDGQDLQAQLMDQMLMAQNGRVIVAAAGNKGGEYTHLSYTLSASDTNFTWFNYPTDSLIEFWADTSAFNNAKFAIGADKTFPSYSARGRSKFISVKDNLNTIRYDTIYNPKHRRIAVIESNTSLQGSAYDVQMIIKPDSSSSSYNWSLFFTGEGKFNLWDPSLNSSGSPPSSMIHNNLPIAPDFPPITKYKLPDTLQTICSSYQCLDHVITVANYNNKNTYIDINGVRVEPTNIRLEGNLDIIRPGNIDITSSTGPTRDDRIKPDIAAPGSMTITTGVLSLIAQFSANSGTAVAVEQSGYIRGTGTSAASPVVAGIAALYLQKNPTAGAIEVKKAILECPITDSFTGNVPNTTWGYGKADAFTALGGCTASLNPRIMESSVFSIYPNPFSSETTLEYDFTKMCLFNSAQLQILDITGKLVRKIGLNNMQGSIKIQRGDLDSGSYFCNLIIDGKSIVSRKLILF